MFGTCLAVACFLFRIFSAQRVHSNDANTVGLPSADGIRRTSFGSTTEIRKRLLLLNFATNPNSTLRIFDTKISAVLRHNTNQQGGKDKLNFAGLDGLSEQKHAI
mgnify:CR=1 FL=1